MYRNTHGFAAELSMFSQGLALAIASSCAYSRRGIVSRAAPLFRRGRAPWERLAGPLISEQAEILESNSEWHLDWVLTKPKC